MMLSRALLTFAAVSSVCSAEFFKSGSATAEWLTGTTHYEGGKPIQTGIRMTIDPGWHTYWVNPGESGTKVTVKWALPEGWTASEISYPVPKRFLTGELPGYGYEGEVIFPVTITPPKDASGPVELAATFSWLACDDASCVPGSAELKLALGGDASADPAAAEKLAAWKARVPKPKSEAKLIVRESGKLLSLSLTLPPESKIDPAGCDVFPISLQSVDHYQPICFSKTGPTWSASVATNEYAKGALSELRLVLAKPGSPPIEVSWKAE